MFGGVGFSLHPPRAGVGLYPSDHGLVLVRLDAPEAVDGAWQVTESRTAEHGCPAPSEARALASFVRAELVRAGWEQLPLALALPAAEAETGLRELPVRLAGAELRAALLWAERAEEDERGEQRPCERCICCMELPDCPSPCYWMACMEEERVRGYFAAFRALSLDLRRLTICPEEESAYADMIAAAYVSRTSWEPVRSEDTPAVYAGMLLYAGAAEHLYWAEEKPLREHIRTAAAPLIAVLATVFFAACVSADVAACMTAQDAAAYAGAELQQHASEYGHMENFFARHNDVAQREEALCAFSTESLPLRALLVHLGGVSVDGIRFTGVRAEGRTVRMDGVAEDYTALAAFMKIMEEDSFFPTAVTLSDTGTVPSRDREAASVIRFTLHSDW